ncbi:MAG: 4-hydroxy-2-oxovalerate aldolase [Chloroflexi bacterium]|nr:4-hydroxy-2-oxovalerate aldolase [Chloroflexota bacterium]
MRTSKILARLRAGQPARLALMGYFLPPFIAYAAHEGYDGVWLDLEHHVMDGREIQTLLAFCHQYDVDMMIRPPTREKGALYRYLEDGATGLMIPHVGDAATARALVSKVKFPPIGDRGIEGFGLETSFGLDIQQSARELVQHANRETFLIVQIETPDGLANVDAIAAVDGVDGLYIGPFDLSIRMEHLPAEQRVPFEDTVARVAAACRAHGKAWGSFALTADDIRFQYNRGAQLLCLGADYLLLRRGLAQSRAELDRVLNT